MHRHQQRNRHVAVVEIRAVYASEQHEQTSDEDFARQVQNVQRAFEESEHGGVLLSGSFR
ncbi:hypothetical protein D3C78_1774380 [compost metagenome]